MSRPDEQIRAAYEVWARGRNLSMARKGDGYRGPYTEWCWHAFYAASRLADEQVAAPSTARTPTNAAPQAKLGESSSQDRGASTGPADAAPSSIAPSVLDAVAWRYRISEGQPWYYCGHNPKGDVPEGWIVEPLWQAAPSAIAAPTRQIDKQVTIQASEYKELAYDAGRYRWLRDNMRRMPLGEAGTRHFFDQPGTMSFQEAVDVAAGAATDGTAASK